jgi:hypothetical protein
MLRQALYWDTLCAFVAPFSAFAECFCTHNLKHVYLCRTPSALCRQLLAGLVRMLGDLGLYSSTFSPRLMEETAGFYKGEGLRLMEASDVPHYLTHCEVRRVMASFCSYSTVFSVAHTAS